MSINITNPNQVVNSHTAERLEIDLISANEDVHKMQIKVYFNIDTILEGEKIAETYWDAKNPLIFDCKDNPRLEAAMLVIQEEIGLRRYAQLTAPPPIAPPVPITGLPPEATEPEPTN